MTYHPERYRILYQQYEDRFQKMFDSIDTSEDFPSVMANFFDTVQKDFSRAVDAKENVPTIGMYFVAPFFILTRYLLGKHDFASLTNMLHNTDYKLLLHYEDDVLTQVPGANTFIHPERLLRYFRIMYAHYGKRLYTVSKDLSWQLEQEKLRKLPTEFLQLPYPTIYLVFPEHLGFKVYNERTGWSPDRKSVV